MPYLACWLWASSHRASCSHRIARCPVNHFTLLFFCFCEKFLLRKSSTFHQLLGRNLKLFCRSVSFHLLLSFYLPFQAKFLLFHRFRCICLGGDKVCYRSRSSISLPHFLLLPGLVSILRMLLRCLLCTSRNLSRLICNTPCPSSRLIQVALMDPFSTSGCKLLLLSL